MFRRDSEGKNYLKEKKHWEQRKPQQLFDWNILQFWQSVNQHESVSHVSVYLMLIMFNFTSFFEIQYEQSLIYMAYMLFYELKASSGH